MTTFPAADASEFPDQTTPPGTVETPPPTQNVVGSSEKKSIAGWIVAAAVALVADAVLFGRAVFLELKIDGHRKRKLIRARKEKQKMHQVS
jgi:hypothetical protein